eukprot:scaffold5500_cov248-Pinguiococcus_pyrenoidosus.AAC.4
MVMSASCPQNRRSRYWVCVSWLFDATSDELFKALSTLPPRARSRSLATCTSLRSSLRNRRKSSRSRPKSSRALPSRSRVARDASPSSSFSAPTSAMQVAEGLFEQIPCLLQRYSSVLPEVGQDHVLPGRCHVGGLEANPAAGVRRPNVQAAAITRSGPWIREAPQLVVQALPCVLQCLAPRCDQLPPLRTCQGAVDIGEQIRERRLSAVEHGASSLLLRTRIVEVGELLGNSGDFQDDVDDACQG